jgi:hypothetical protein
VNKFIDYKLLDSTSVSYLRQNGVELYSNISVLLNYGTEAEILEKISRFDKSVLMEHIEHVKHDSVISLLIDRFFADHNQTGSSIKKEVKAAYKVCVSKLHLNLLASLIKKYGSIVKPSASDITALFKPHKPKTKVGVVRRRYRRRTVAFNKDLIKIKAQPDAVDRVLHSMIEAQIDIPYSTFLIKYLAKCSSVSIICDLLDYYKTNVTVSRKMRDKLRHEIKMIYRRNTDTLIERTLKSDDIDGFKKLISYDLLSVQDLHTNRCYIRHAITSDAQKIGSYMCTDLKIKMLCYNTSTIWGWSFFRTSEDKMLINLRFMKENGIPYPDDLLPKVLRFKKYKVLSYLVEQGVKFGLNYAYAIQQMDVQNFNKYTTLMNIDRVQMIKALVKWGGDDRLSIYDHGKRTNNAKLPYYTNIMNIIDEQDEVLRSKLAKKTAILSLKSNNGGLVSGLVSKYKFDMSFKDIQKIVGAKSYNSGNCELFLMIKKSYPKILQTIKSQSVEFKLRLIFGSKLREYYDRFTKIHVSHFLSICTSDQDYSIEMYKQLYDKFIIPQNRYYTWNDEKGNVTAGIAAEFAAYIHKIQGYDDHIPYIMENGGMLVLNELATFDPNLYSKFTIKYIYSSCLSMLGLYFNIDGAIIILAKSSKVHKITPFVWDIMATGCLYYKMRNGWIPTDFTKRIMNLAKICDSITQETCDSLKNLFVVRNGRQVKVKNFVTMLEKLHIVEYVRTDDEVPDDFNVYARRFNDLIEYDNSDNSEDIEDVLQKAEREIIEENTGMRIDADVNAIEYVNNAIAVNVRA